MNAKQTIESSMNMSHLVLTKYLEDLSDADLMQRPGAGCNHLAWQLGHLISSETSLINSICPGKGASLPAGFAENHAPENRGSDDPGQFCTKRQYLELFEKAQASTKSALAELPDSRLDAQAPEHLRRMFPTVGDIFVLIASHPMMHAGQFAVARRHLGKPIVI